MRPPLMRRGRPDIVPADATEEDLRRMYGQDANEVIAFHRYLRLSPDDRAAKHWQEWEHSLISGSDVLVADDALR